VPSARVTVSEPVEPMRAYVVPRREMFTRTVAGRGASAGVPAAGCGMLATMTAAMATRASQIITIPSRTPPA
jgi:hypothetical protein